MNSTNRSRVPSVGYAVGKQSYESLSIPDNRSSPSIQRNSQMRMPKSSKRVPTVLSLFSGLGGLDLGLARAGFNVVAHVERDPKARRSLTHNFDTPHFLEPHDLVELVDDFASFPYLPGAIDVIAGGPPCQPFSPAAQYRKSGRAGMQDPRANTVFALFALIKHLLPRVVLLENVAGFLSESIGALSEISAFFNELADEGGPRYALHSRVLDAADYGVPQHRRRGILLAVRSAEWVWPRATHTDRPTRAWDALRRVTPENPPAPSGKWADLLPSIPEGENYQWFTERGGGPNLFGYRTRFWSFLLKLAKDQPSWTIPASPGPSTGPFHWDGRPLSVEEALILQSFPKDYQVTGTRRQAFKQIGNATPPLLAEVLGRALGEQLFGLEYSEKPSLHISRARALPPPKEPTPMPDSFQHLIGEHAPHPGPGLGPAPISMED